MSIPTLTFFNNKGGVGKTSLVYHLAWMFADTGRSVLCVDLDPQANLTAAFINEEEIEALWGDTSTVNTIYRAVQPLTGVSDIEDPELYFVAENLHLIPGDVALSSFEDTLSEAWPASMADKNLFRPFRILTAFHLVIQQSAAKLDADIILVDIGPNLGAINRSVLISTDNVLIPLGADLFSLQGLKNLGPTLRSWRALWNKRLDNWADPDFQLPEGIMKPVGYLCQQYGVRLDRPVKAYDKWVKRIPTVYRKYVLDQDSIGNIPDQDPYCLATIKHYRSLMPMAQEQRKPIFQLTAADGAIGGHANAVQSAYRDFLELADIIAKLIDLD